MKRPFDFTNFFDINENMVVDDFHGWRDILCNRRISPQLLQLISKFTVSQLKEVRLGIEHGLSEACIKKYVEPKLSYWLMEQVRLGFEDGLSISQVEMYIHLDDAEGMKQMRLGIKNHLTEEQLEQLVKTAPAYMNTVREVFEFKNAASSIKSLIEHYPKD